MPVGSLAEVDDLCEYGLLRNAETARCELPESIPCSVQSDCATTSSVIPPEWYCCDENKCRFLGSPDCTAVFNEFWGHNRGAPRNVFDLGFGDVEKARLQCRMERCLALNSDRVAPEVRLSPCSAAISTQRSTLGAVGLLALAVLFSAAVALAR
eukprot:TRINITY_DN6863_c0_g1_i1.p2 TRINITY_DN6863_c0_g1~~TRINITY_DN6863_c0_g1_i1.p2  ORF type:complete len:154 (+),score=7.11 TRINITY_DN6863_c0_g1_i1:453-914(+)